jgi:hypothetical protein
MQPYSETRKVKEGVPIAPSTIAAYGTANDMQASAAAAEHNAATQLQPHIEAMERARLAAMDKARMDHEVLAHERQAVMQKRMAEIETLNKAAQGKPEDLWNSGHIFARVVGTLLSAVGFVAAAKGGRGQMAGIGTMAAGSILNGLVNQDIGSKREARESAAAQAKRQTDLLKLHEVDFNDRDKAIDATKLAYYDNILQNMEALKAGPYANQINDAAYLRLQSKILQDRAELAERLQTKMAAQIEGESVAHYRAPQVLGGGGASGLKDIPNTVTLSDNTTWDLGDSESAKKARERIVAMQKLKDLNVEIKKLRQEAYTLSSDPLSKDHVRYQTIKALLEDKGAQKAPLMSMALDGSTIRKDEREEIENKNIKATEGIGLVHNSGQVNHFTKAARSAADAVLDAQNKQWDDAQRTEATAAGGRQVRSGYVTDEHGELRPVKRYVGVNAMPSSTLAPPSFKPDASGSSRPTQGRPTGERYPKAPNFGVQRSPTTQPHKKKKEEG